MPTESDLRAAKQDLVGRYLRQPASAFVARATAAGARVIPGPDPVGNVVGVGIGEKVVLNQLSGELCVKLYVRRKMIEAEIPPQERIPKSIAGILTDVEEVGLISAFQQTCSVNRRRHQAPAPCGISVGHVQITAGTIGALARTSGRTDDGHRYILSNNHVLANSNNAQAGDEIFQPGPLDGGVPAANRVGTLTRFVRINFAGGENSADCAIAEVPGGAVLSEICSVGAVTGTVRPARDMTVFKHGRTTGLTRGVITDVDADVRVDYREAGVALFVNSVAIRGLPPTTPFSDGGDSGSIILDAQRRACALLFAGSDTVDVTFANRIQTVLRRLRIRLL
jgi:hypothetical protein